MSTTIYLRPRNFMSGPIVTKFQDYAEAILQENLVNNDGVFGPATEALAKKLQVYFGLNDDGVVGQATWEKIFEYFAALPSGAKLYLIGETVVKDGRAFFDPPKRCFYGKRREWSQIEGVMLHQTGCMMPDRETAWQPINAHIGVNRAGEIILMHDFQDEIWHGNNLSKQTIGIEIAGNFYGIDGVSGTCWKEGGGPHKLTDGQKTALQNLFFVLQAEFEEAGQPWTKIYAHRQSDGVNREADPGEEIWETVALDWQARLGADDGGPNFKVDKGKTIPREWNSQYSHKYWG